MKGIYVLTISINGDVHVEIGALGKIFFRKGVYVYVGSAQNSLEKRVERHLAKEKVNFWHIDYLLENEQANVVKVFCKKAAKTEECKVAQKLEKKGVSIPNFGCSDCDCISHLFLIDKSNYPCSYLSSVLNDLSFSHYNVNCGHIS